MRFWLWLLVLLALGSGYEFWGARSVSHPPGILAAAEPVQKDLGANPPHFRRNDADIQALATFEIEARVLGVERYRFDPLASLAPVDLALGWGPMSDTKVVSRLSFSQGNRFYFWRTDEFPIPRRDIETHSANMHLIAADPLIDKQIKATRVGQIVRLAGYLVEVHTAAGYSIRSSLTREDTGAGACEVIWVESYERE